MGTAQIRKELETAFNRLAPEQRQPALCECCRKNGHHPRDRKGYCKIGRNGATCDGKNSFQPRDTSALDRGFRVVGIITRRSRA